MNNQELSLHFSGLSTPQIADACVRLGESLRVAPAGIRPLISGSKVAGGAVPTRHYGSVDIFFEAIGRAHRGDILVIDNGGRDDEGCVGDLTALEAKTAGMAGIILWGTHRDSSEIAEMALPLFSYGACLVGPLRADPREPEALDSARFGRFTVTAEDAVFADADGVIFVPLRQAEALIATAEEIRDIERRQAEYVGRGQTLRQQFQFDAYLRQRAADPAYTFRDHVKNIGGAIEE